MKMSKKKIINIIVILLFFLIMLVPVITMNHKQNYVSEIDNKVLTNNPFSREMRNRPGASFAKDMHHYVKERIGFRNEMIYFWTVLNDALFNEMIHPIYCYGKDGYVFSQAMTPPTYTDYHDTFVEMVVKCQQYCEERGIPFIFAFEPRKNSVYQDKLPNGVLWKNIWVSEFFNNLDKNNINYVDNTDYLIVQKENGEQVFNVKYDANHWNDIGAFYGINNIFTNMKQIFPAIQLNKKGDFIISDELVEYLPVSIFPIKEYVPNFELKSHINDLTDIYKDEVEISKNHSTFYYFENNDKKISGNPKTLVFQGSYINGIGKKMLANGLGEYIGVHDYDNILELPYYINLFNPECVIFEVAEYTLKDQYFSYDKMKTLNWNPVLKNYHKKFENINNEILNGVEINEGQVFTKISWKAPKKVEYAWLIAGKEFDMRQIESSNEIIYEVTIPMYVYLNNKTNLVIVTADDNELDVYK